MVKVSATGDFDKALSLASNYLEQLKRERTNAEEAIAIVWEILSDVTAEHCHSLKRKEVSEYLNISMDTLRNWEMNGLLTIKRRENGYRVYLDDDIQRLKIIRSLRCANYSLEAILHLLRHLSKHPNVDILEVLNTPPADTDIITVCDQLITSLSAAENNALKMVAMLQEMKIRFS